MARVSVLLKAAVCAGFALTLFGQSAVADVTSGILSCRASAVRIEGSALLPDTEPYVANASGSPCSFSYESQSNDALAPLYALNDDQFTDLVETVFPAAPPDGTLLTLQLFAVGTSFSRFGFDETGPRDFPVAQAESLIERVKITDPTGTIAFEAESLSSTAELDCSSGAPVLSSSSSVTSLGEPLNEPRDITIPGLGRLWLNREEITTAENGVTLTRTALVFEDATGAIGDLHLAESTVGLDGTCPPSTPSGEPGPRGFNILIL